MLTRVLDVSVLSGRLYWRPFPDLVPARVHTWSVARAGLRVAMLKLTREQGLVTD